MAIVLLIGGAGLLALPGLGRGLGRLLAPREWTKLCAVALTAGAASVEIGVVLLAAPTLLRTLGVHALEAACERLAGPLAPVGPAGWVAVFIAWLVPFLALRGVHVARRSCRTLWLEPWIGERVDADGLDVVVLPTDEVVAMSIEGITPQIVVSRGLRNLLLPAQFAAVIRHEAAHLRFRHQRLLLLAVAVDHGFLHFPLFARSTDALRTATERWADESAAGDATESRLHLRQALFVVAGVRLGPAVGPFSRAETVQERLDALEKDPPRPSVLAHALAYAPGLALGAGLAFAIAAWAVQAQALAVAVASCPV